MPYKNKADLKAYNRRKHRKNEEALRILKSEPCTDCKRKFPHYVMEFDHVPERGKKRGTIATLVGASSLEAPSVKEELAKCDLVCANCHKIRTYERRQQGIEP